MDVVPVGPGFAAELRGIALADVASDDAVYAATRAAFEEHSVLVFRSQEVTDDIQLEFSRRFGPPEVTKVGSQGTGTHFVILSTIGPDGTVVPPDHRIALRKKAKLLRGITLHDPADQMYCNHPRGEPFLGINDTGSPSCCARRHAAHL